MRNLFSQSKHCGWRLAWSSSYLLTALFAAGVSGGLAVADAGAQPAPAPPSAAAEAVMATWSPPQRRRIYLLRHGDVAYFDAQGKPVADADLVVLSDKGRAQPTRQANTCCGTGREEFDRVYASTLPRTQGDHDARTGRRGYHG